MPINWDKEIAQAQRAMARNKANIMNAPTANGTAAFWSSPKYSINKQVNDLDDLHARDKKRQKKAVFKAIEKSRRIQKIQNGEEIVERPKRRRKRGQPKHRHRKPQS